MGNLSSIKEKNISPILSDSYLFESNLLRVVCLKLFY
jgi:hypothetical protein